MTELTFLKVLISVRQVHQKSVCFLDKEFTFQPDVCNACHEVLMMSMNLSDIAFESFTVIIVVYNGTRKSEARGLLESANLNKKNGAI